MADKTDPLQAPEILSVRQIAESRLFHIEQVDLKFSNGQLRTYERMRGSGRGAVMLVPLLDEQTLLLIREYSVGTNDYQLSFPKGLVDPGETSTEAGNRELMEEIGYGAKELTHIRKLMLAPGYFKASMDIYLARDLYPQSLPGDEPEPLQVVPWPIKDYKELLAQPDFMEARSIAALMLVKDFLEGK
jgi:ADP-ribose diphosphatase